MERELGSAPGWEGVTDRFVEVFAQVFERPIRRGDPLGVLAYARVWGGRITTKSGLMLGLGEHATEVLQVLRDLCQAGCTVLTLGRYLQPTESQLPVARYLSPEEFRWYGEQAERMGFRGVAAGPVVRNSYQAEELYVKTV